MSDQTEKRNIVLGITGSVAAYKAVELARLLVSNAYNVRCVMTEGAQKFITTMMLEAVTGNPVTSDFWDKSSGGGIEHIEIAEWADVLVIAPATADSIAKLAHGFSDSPLLAIALATRAPILVAPAMNVVMYENIRTKQNIESLKSQNVLFVDPEEGALACGWQGTGRLANPNEIFSHIRRALSVADYSGKRILITAGPTREMIDPVRFVSNRSSGKMGLSLAFEAFRRGAEVTLVHGQISASLLSSLPSGIRKIEVGSAEQMKEAVERMVYEDEVSNPHIVIMSAAVADYAPASVAKSKIKKSSNNMRLDLELNPDILKTLGDKKKKQEGPILVGFAVETGEMEDLLTELENKLSKKNADLMVGNFAEDSFDLDTNRVWLIDRNGRRGEVATASKQRVAEKIFDAILRI
jgi:phosphopantothenoylcysteine decarboxylase / phosphopantothenate---cysteine ligase